jgi:2-oxoglutarate ferredoxin oxidoreductase subunit beta
MNTIAEVTPQQALKRKQIDTPMDEMIQMYADVPEKNFRYCPGCGLGMAQSAIMRAFDRLGLDPSKVATAGGSGCYSPLAHYLKSSHIHGSHGRACAYATGLKMAKPELTVLALQGDGDCLSIGGNHFIHAARRNIDITVICFNNFGFGDTGGQFGPTTPKGSVTETSNAGMPEAAFDACKLAIGAGATYVAHLTKMIADAIAWKGFAFVEVLQNCHVFWGKRNGMPQAMDMLKYFKDNSVRNTNTPQEEWFDIPTYAVDEKNMKFVLGLLHKEARNEFGQDYDKLRQRAMEQAGSVPG